MKVAENSLVIPAISGKATERVEKILSVALNFIFFTQSHKPLWYLSNAMGTASSSTV